MVNQLLTNYLIFSWLNCLTDWTNISNTFRSLTFLLFIFRCKSPFFGSPRFLWLSTEHDFLSKICVAADYSDSLSDSYHPLEKLKVSNDVPPARLSYAEIARTTIEVCAYMLSCMWNQLICNIYVYKPSKHDSIFVFTVHI